MVNSDDSSQGSHRMAVCFHVGYHTAALNILRLRCLLMSPQSYHSLLRLCLPAVLL